MEKENYICIFGKIIELIPEQVRKIKEVFDEPVRKLQDIQEGETFKVGKHEFIVLEHQAGMTKVIYRGLLHNNMQFGENNNFDGSKVDAACEAFAKELAELIGAENIVEHNVDLLSDDGLDDYGEIERKVSLMTTEQYRRYVKILDKDRLEKWWWLATPHSTATHESDEWIKCVSPRGCFDFDLCNHDYCGVRPFCIFKSNIFVS